MKILIKQRKKDLYNAFFSILNEAGMETGNISLKGSLGSREGFFDIHYEDIGIQLYRIGGKEAKEQSALITKNTPFRPYQVMANGLPADSGFARMDYQPIDTGSSPFAFKGILFHDFIRRGFLKKTGFHVLYIGNLTYNLYIAGFGEEGIFASIYKGNKPVGLIHKDCEVTDGLHNFLVTADDRMDCVSGTILSCYMYIYTYYRPGEKIVKGTYRSIFTTTDEFLLSKCIRR